jgi:DHA3 family macrolide efflux protein-like MFS transporter
MQTKANQATFGSYVLFLSGQLVSLLGSSVTSFVIIWWITLETGSPMYLALASLVGFAPMIILAPFAGVFVDRWERKRLIGVADFLQALATILLIFLFSWSIVSIWHVLAVLALKGVFQAFHSPAIAAIVPVMVPKDKLSRVNGVNFLLSGVVNVLGPVIAATLLELWRIDQILWIDAATFIVAVIPLMMISIPSVRKKADETRDRLSFREEFGEGLAFIKKARGFLTFIMLATALNFLLTPLSTQVPYFVKFDHFGEASDWALISISVQGGTIAGGLLMSLIKGFRKKMVAIVLSVYVIFSGYAMIAITPTGQFWFMAIGGLILAVCLPVANVSIQTIVQTVVPKKMLGRVNSVMGALASAASPLGMILSGIIVEVTRTANLFLACSILGIVILTISWLFTDIKHVE